MEEPVWLGRKGSMKSRSFFITFIAANVGLVLYGILALVKPDILLETFLTHVYQFPAQARSATTYISALYRLLGYLNIIPGLLGLLFLYRYRMNRHEWDLRLVVASTSLSYIGPVVFDNTVGTIGLFEMLEHFLLLLVVIVGLRELNLKKQVLNLIDHLGATRLGVRIIKHLIAPFQRFVYHVSAGRFFSNLGKDRNVLLLTTKGRRTGKDRTIPVFYIRDDDRIIICNVKPEHEGINPWVINLRSNPIARLQIGRDTKQYRAREANQSEVDRFWSSLTKLWPAFQSHFERGGSRTIFILELVW